MGSLQHEREKKREKEKRERAFFLWVSFVVAWL